MILAEMPLELRNDHKSTRERRVILSLLRTKGGTVDAKIEHSWSYGLNQEINHPHETPLSNPYSVKFDY